MLTALCRSRITGRTADIQDLHPHAASSTPRLPAIATAGIMDSLAGSTHSSLLSPLASEDLSAQPLSPATLAFFQAIELELDEMQVLPSSKVTLLSPAAGMCAHACWHI